MLDVQQHQVNRVEPGVADLSTKRTLRIERRVQIELAMQPV
nr:hypothetical protein [Dyella silvae]